MPYRLNIAGLAIECDTIEELRDAVRSLGQNGNGAISQKYRAAPSDSAVVDDGQWTPDQYVKFLSYVQKPRQKQLLKILFAGGSGWTTTVDIQREMGAQAKSNSAISGSLQVCEEREAGEQHPRDFSRAH